jgi:hypothetical protein
LIGWRRRRRLWRGRRITRGKQLDIKDQIALWGDHWRPAALSIGELVGNEETALSANVHAGEAEIPAGDDAMCPLLEGEGLIAIE